MAEVSWQARRVTDSVLVDVTAEIAGGVPSNAPTQNPIEGSTPFQDQQQVLIQATTAPAGLGGNLTLDAGGDNAAGIATLSGGAAIAGKLGGTARIQGGTGHAGAGSAAYLQVDGGEPDGTPGRAELTAQEFLLQNPSGNPLFRTEPTKLSFFAAAPVVQQAANADTSGANLAALETEVNELKALLRAYGLLAT